MIARMAQLTPAQLRLGQAERRVVGDRHRIALQQMFVDGLDARGFDSTDARLVLAQLAETWRASVALRARMRTMLGTPGGDGSRRSETA